MFSAAKTAAPSAGGYNLTRSLRFRSSASASLSRTPASAGNRQKWTWSGWLKRGALGSNSCFFSQGNNIFVARFNSSTDVLEVYDVTGGPYQLQLITSQVFRDPSSWYHLVISTDTTQATSSNRVKLYINGSQITAFSTATYYSQNYNTEVNTTDVTNIGALAFVGQYFDGYLAEVNFIDGQQLTPSSFGSTNALTGVWQPARYTGTYGTNGFYLPFTDNSALTTSSNVGLGKDFSGNGNYWATNNISITSGVTYDSMTDVPTLTSATAANFCVLNPITRPAGAGTAFSTSGGNLNCAVAYVGPDSTIAMSTGKWYWEVIPTSGVSSNNPRIGIVPSNHGTYSGTGVGDPSGTYGYASTGQKATGGTYTSYGASFTDNDVIGIALDMTAGTIVFYKNGVSQGTAFTGLTGEFLASVGTGSSTTMNLSFNFGQRPFAYTPPTGYVALNTYNLPTPTILAGNKYMDATLYTGTGSALTVTNAAPFQPDFVWIKRRDTTANNALFDSVRGVRKVLISNATDAEVTETVGTSLTAFNSNGFSLGTNGGAASVNVNGGTFVGWQWQAGQGTTSSNTNGSITSTVSVNASAGFSVVTYTGNSTNSTVGHGLGVAPSMILIKGRTNVSDWRVYHVSVALPNVLNLNTTSAAASDPAAFTSTSPTSSVFSIGSGAGVNSSGNTYVAYCFAPIAGYSAFGKYTANGVADGPFIYLGFRPKFIMVKNITANNTDWTMLDTSRDTYNGMQNVLLANSNNAETTGSTPPYADGLSNGFKLRSGNAYMNYSTTDYIYMAFAENPLKYALAR